MFGLVLDAVGCVLMACITAQSIVLHIRLGRLRRVLLEVGEVLPTFDESVNQVAAVANGFTSRFMAELQTVESQVAAARRLSSDLAAVSRTAEGAAAQLERLLRQHKRLEAVRAATLPRSMVEPKGFAERAGLPPAQPAPVAAPHADEPLSHDPEMPTPAPDWAETGAVA